MKIEDIIDCFKPDSKLDSALDRLANLVVDQQSLKISSFNKDIDKELLLNEGIIIGDENTGYNIEICDKFIYYLLKVYENRKEFAFSFDIVTWINIINKLHKIKHGRAFDVIFYSFMLQYFKKFHPQSLAKIISSKEIDIWSIIKALNEEIIKLQLTPVQLYELIKLIIKEHHDDTVVNYPYAFITKYCQMDYDKGLQFLNLALSTLSDPYNNIIIYSLSGLLDNDYPKAKELLYSLAKDNRLEEIIVYSLLNNLRIHPERSLEFYDLVSSFTNFISDAALKFYWKIYLLNDERQKKAESKIIDILDQLTEGIINTSIGELIFMDSINDFVRTYIEKVVSSQHFTIKHIGLLDRNIAQICDASMLFSIITETASRFKINIKVDLFDNSIRSVLQKHPQEFMNGVISLIINDKGFVRYIGRQIWDSNNLINSDFNALKLLEEQQFKFVISMLQDCANPDNRLKKLLPLLDSSNKSVVQLLRDMLYSYVDNYMGAVMDIVGSCKIKNRNAIASVKEYYENRKEFIDKRFECKELSPLYTQYSEMKEFRRSDSEHMKEIIKRSDNNSGSSFLDSFPTVLLAKGGGFRDENGKVSELSCFSHSIPFPAMYYALGDTGETEMNVKMFSNWDNTDDLWKIL